MSDQNDRLGSALLDAALDELIAKTLGEELKNATPQGGETIENVGNGFLVHIAAKSKTLLHVQNICNIFFGEEKNFIKLTSGDMFYVDRSAAEEAEAAWTDWHAWVNDNKDELGKKA